MSEKSKRERGSLVQRGARVIARVRCGRNAAGEEQRYEQRIPWATERDDAAYARLGEMVSLADKLLEAGRPDVIKATLEKAAAATTKEQLQLVRSAVEKIAKLKVADTKREAVLGVTYGEIARQLVSGEAAKELPDDVKDIDQTLNKQRLDRYILPYVADVPVTAFTVAHGDLVKSKLPRSLKPTTRAQICRVMARVLHIAVLKRIILHSPLPEGFIPKKNKPPLFTYLFPDEERALLGCKEVPEVFRLLVGVINREGFRISEVRDSTWKQWTLDVGETGKGAFSLPKNKTGVARHWTLADDTRLAMKIWAEKVGAKPNDRPFAALDEVTKDDLVLYKTTRKGRGGKRPKILVQREKEAAYLRAALKLAGQNREALHESTETTGRMRAHDLRATFVTYALRSGQSFERISDRTGHTTSAMMERYRRSVRQLEELTLGSLGNLVEGLGWVSGWVSGPSGGGSGNGPGAHDAPVFTDGAREGGRTPTPSRAAEPKGAVIDSGVCDTALSPGESTESLPLKTGDTQSTPTFRGSTGASSVSPDGTSSGAEIEPLAAALSNARKLAADAGDWALVTQLTEQLQALAPKPVLRIVPKVRS